MIIVGRIAGPRGLDGTVKIETALSADDLRGAGVRLFLAGADTATLPGRPVELETAIPWKAGVAGRFRGIDTREAAEAISGSTLVAEGLTPGRGSYFFSQLRGLGVRSIGGEDLGTVVDILSTGAQDLLVVARAGQEWYLPMVGSMVRRVDLEGECITVELPEGLIDVNP